MLEEWKAIKGYEGYYEVSNTGKVKSIRNNIILKAHLKNGYFAVSLVVNGYAKQKYIHRLVAESFIDNRHELKEVKHKDCDKTNNDVTNLEWCTKSENVKHTYSVGGRENNWKTHIGNNYRGVGVLVYWQGLTIPFENMKTASIYIGKYSDYISKRVRRTGSKIFTVEGCRIEVMSE